ncbi:MAG: hypothetical protein H0X66_16060 [Verrucomicrobia bacterium]|nr:hypothetical protein [Verrucomicrobiota bacterium]
MRRPIIILLSGIVLAVAAFCGFYFSTTAYQRSMLQSDAPELAWLKQEFHLSDSEFQRVSQLHEGYLPHCAEMCSRIAAKNEELETLLKTAETLTPEIEEKLREANDLRFECQRGMLQHFFQVSRAMPPEQGKRYLEWVQQRTLLGHGGMMSESHGAHE